MNNRRNVLSVLSLALMLLATAALAAPVDDEQAKVGEKAPDFTLTSADGKEHSLSDYEGKIVVLQWINPDCPVCRRVMSKGLTNKMVKQLKTMDPEIVHLTINSTHYMKGEKSAAYLKKHEVKAPALIDRDGTVGKMYGARTTPHMYVIDSEGILRYQGAFDDDPRGGTEGATNYVVNTVKMIKAGETVSPDYVKPYGCQVKYKP